MTLFKKIVAAPFALLAAANAWAANPQPTLLNDPVDVSGELHELVLTKQNGEFKLASDPFAGKVAWKISTQ